MDVDNQTTNSKDDDNNNNNNNNSDNPMNEQEEEKLRFTRELEFVMCLANPAYIGDLANKGLLKNPAFMKFLSYLCYFHKSPYTSLVHYPHALHNLELLQHESFREAITNDPEGVVSFLAKKQVAHWATWMTSGAPNTNTTNTSNNVAGASGGGDAEQPGNAANTTTTTTATNGLTSTVSPTKDT